MMFYVEKLWGGTYVLKARDLIPGSRSETLRKWEILAHCAREGYLIQDGGRNTCSLCQKYRSCKDCPIHNKVGGCAFTPFLQYAAAVFEENPAAAHQAALDMIAFLEELDWR